NSSGGLVTIGNAASNAPVTLGSTGTVTAQSVKINGAANVTVAGVVNSVGDALVSGSNVQEAASGSVN
ncbi:hypothetical protein QN363_21050, partial [Undibacterium sp. CCC2.1]